MFVPSVPVLLGLASELEPQRDHVLGRPHRRGEQWDDELLAAAQVQQDEPGEEEAAFTALGAQAELDQLIYEGHVVLRGRGGLSRAARSARTGAGAHTAQPAAAGLAVAIAAGAGRGASRGPRAGAERPQPSVRERLAALRKELNTLVAMYHHRTDKPHGMIHNELRAQCGGPPTAMANMEQLEERIATLRSWR